MVNEEMRRERGETLAADLHVHHHDDAIDLVVCRDNVYLGVELGPEELELILHSIRLHISSITVTCDAGRVEIVDVGDEWEGEKGIVLIGLSHVESDHILWVARERTTLVRLLAGGCGAHSLKDIPTSKCSSAN